jgi:hypothetical protein
MVCAAYELRARERVLRAPPLRALPLRELLLRELVPRLRPLDELERVDELRERLEELLRDAEPLRRVLRRRPDVAR